MALRKHAYAIYCDIHSCKNDDFQMKNCYVFFLSFAQNIDRGYTLEPEAVLTSTHYLCFIAKLGKVYTPVNPSFTI